MTTALDCIQDSLEKIGVYAPGETITDADAERCLTVLNNMIDSWSNENLTCFAFYEQGIPLQVGKNRYTIGQQAPAMPAPDIVATRPLRIVNGPGAAFLLDTNFNRYPVDVVPQDYWNMIWNLVAVNSNLPNILFYDPQYPYGILNVFPMPNTGNYTMYFDYWEPFSTFGNLTASLSLPPGYEKAIKDCLAIEVGPYFKPDSWVPSPILLQIAAKSKGNVKRGNLQNREPRAVFDREISSRTTRPYNIYSDSYR